MSEEIGPSPVSVTPTRLIDCAGVSEREVLSGLFQCCIHRRFKMSMCRLNRSSTSTQRADSEKTQLSSVLFLGNVVLVSCETVLLTLFWGFAPHGGNARFFSGPVLLQSDRSGEGSCGLKHQTEMEKGLGCFQRVNNSQWLNPNGFGENIDFFGVESHPFLNDLYTSC